RDIEPDVRHQLRRLERGRQVAHEEIVGRDCSGTGEATKLERGVQGHRYQGQLGGWVRVDEASAYGATTPNAWGADESRCLCQQRKIAPDRGRVFDLPLTGERLDRDAAVMPREPAHVCHVVEIDQVGRPRQPEVHKWNEALAAREDLRVGSILIEQAERLF